MRPEFCLAAAPAQKTRRAAEIDPAAGHETITFDLLQAGVERRKDARFR